MEAAEDKTQEGGEATSMPIEAKRVGAESRAAALGRLAFLLSAAQEPVTAAAYVLDTAFELFQWDASFLILYNAVTDRVDDLVNIDTVGGRRQSVPAVLQDKPPSPMMRRVITEGPQLILRKEAKDFNGATAPFGDKGRLSLSLMYVPVRLENRCIGVLSVQSYEPNAYSQGDLETLQGLADHAAGALGRLQAETELRASEERLRLAVDSFGLGTWDYCQATDQFSFSETCANILGLDSSCEVSFESFLGQLQSCGETNPAELLRQTLRNESGSPLHVECRIRLPDKSGRWAILGAKRILAHKHRGPATVRLIGTVLDITKRKQAEKALCAAQEELSAHAQDLEKTVEKRTARLQETVNELEHVSYALKHDMRAPLRAMQVYAQFVEEELKGFERPKALEYLRLIRMASRRLDQLIQDSLNYNRAVLDKLVLKPINLGQLLTGLVETYPQFSAGEAQIKLEQDLPVVLGNEAALTQCFANLLDNAVKFVRPGEQARVRVWAEPRGDLARVWVEDRGIGVAQTFQERAFDMFQRGTNNYEGTGIGLAIVRKLMQRMGGGTGMESVEGQGSRFWVELRKV
jgi:signal transduction histidine kinase